MFNTNCTHFVIKDMYVLEYFCNVYNKQEFNFVYLLSRPELLLEMPICSSDILRACLGSVLTFSF